MPRIDPLQLLRCLSVLLTPEGGILSSEEVTRLVNLMTKFSKKLVSKCIYMLILKNTEPELVNMFMIEGGWDLIQDWLQSAMVTSNWDLVREIIELLLATPVDVDRLKINNLPKLIKTLSKRVELGDVAELSNQLVQQWLTVVKKAQTPPQQETAEQIAQKEQSALVNGEATKGNMETENAKEQKIEYIKEEEPLNNGTGKRKIVLRIITNTNKDAKDEPAEAEITDKNDLRKDEKKNKEKSSGSSSSSSSKSKSGSSKDKDKKRSSSSSKSSSSSSRSKSSSRDHDRKHRDKDKDRDRKHSSSSSRSSSKSGSRDKDRKERDKEKYKSDKERQEEKDQDTLDKLKTPKIDKLGRIPKKTNTDDKSQSSKDGVDIKKKFSIGIGKDRDKEERPKTVKVFNSKMRSTGLEEEVKPAPPRNSGKKPTPSVQLPTIPQKRPSPPKEIRDPTVPPEKKLKIDKIDVPERPGAIKLIPPKPKPAFLQESDIFSDALTAASTKKEPKKRKRRPSIGKDGKDVPSSPSSSTTSEQPAQLSPDASSPLGIKNLAPINFYQDTLSQENEEPKSDDENKESDVENVDDVKTKKDEVDEETETPASPPGTPTDDLKEEEPTVVKRPRFSSGLKGVLLYSKKRGPKKSISWKSEDDLVEIRYFELDETERVNVSRTSFGDMAKMEMTSEREALQMSRKVGGEDLMEAQINWRFPIVIELPDPLVAPGSKSLEKDIQFAREKTVLQALYFDKRKIPDSPEEPIPENHQMIDPVIIPLEDPDGQEIDLRSTPWPEPKPMAPQQEPIVNQPIFPNVPAPFQAPFSSIPPPGFQPIPQRFPGPVPGPGPMGPMGMAPGFMPPNMMPNGNMMGPNVGPVPPNMFPPGPMPDGFIPPGSDFPIFHNQHPPNMNMFGPNNFRMNRPVGGGDRGGRGFRRGGGDGSMWVRMNANNNWKRGGGGGNRGGRLCKNIQNHGFCRNRDNCPFVHP